MATDRYRKQTQGNTDIQKRVLLHRVMEPQQVDTSLEDERERNISVQQRQNERLPEWFSE